MGAFSALVGLIVNCKFPRFDWTNAAKVAKNSAGVVAAVFISMALCFGGLLLAIKLPLPDPMLLPAIFTIALAVACAASGWSCAIARRSGSRRCTDPKTSQSRPAFQPGGFQSADKAHNRKNCPIN